MVAKKKSTAKKKKAATKKKVTAKKNVVAKKAPAAKTTTKKKVVKKKSVAKKKVAVKKVAVKKKAAKKKTAKKSTAAATPMKATATKQTKSQVIAAISESTGLSKKEVGSVFSTMSDLVVSHMKRRGSGEFTIPEMGVKIRRVKKPATKSRKGVNPFTGEAITIKAKPARNQVRLSALKSLKESVLK